jgi:hypothetical protein
MGLLRTGISIVNFDETYFAQKGLQRYPHEDIDFQQMRHVNLYCENDSLVLLSRQLYKRNHKGITFIGSGNYHYLTYLFLKEIAKPFTLVLFDNHPDLGTDQDQGENLLSCGSWVSYALKDIPLLQQVVIIGPTAILDHHIHHPRVVIFPFKGRNHYSLKSILSAIHTQNVYISIDKDVLNTTEVSTNWDQGVMELATLTQYVEYILKQKDVEGVDICGEAHLLPTDLLLPDYQTMIQKNETANLKILQTCLQTSHQQTRGA